jgi:hypothetical protein
MSYEQGILWEKGWRVEAGRGLSGSFALERRAQDDGKNKQRQEQTTARTNNGKNRQRQEQTTARTDNGKNRQRQEQTTARTDNGKNRQRQEQTTARTDNGKNEMRGSFDCAARRVRELLRSG